MFVDVGPRYSINGAAFGTVQACPSWLGGKRHTYFIRVWRFFLPSSWVHGQEVTDRNRENKRLRVEKNNNAKDKNMVEKYTALA